jgi:hypothetical protein
MLQSWSLGKIHKEPHHFSCRSRIEMLNEPNHFAFMEPDPDFHQDDADHWARATRSCIISFAVAASKC